MPVRAKTPPQQVTSDVDHGPSEIIPGLWVGSVYDAAHTALLIRLGIGAILNVSGDEIPNGHTRLFRYMRIPMLDADDFPIYEYFHTTNSFIKQALNDGLQVLVHCVAGASRSTTIIAAYLIAEHGWSARRAMDRLIQRRPQFWPNDGFVRTLFRYDRFINQ